jgi:hypothetical protein
MLNLLLSSDGQASQEELEGGASKSTNEGKTFVIAWLFS